MEISENKTDENDINCRQPLFVLEITAIHAQQTLEQYYNIFNSL